MNNVIKVHFDAKIAEDAMNDLIDMAESGEIDWDEAKEKLAKFAPYLERLCGEENETKA